MKKIKTLLIFASILILGKETQSQPFIGYDFINGNTPTPNHTYYCTSSVPVSEVFYINNGIQARLDHFSFLISGTNCSGSITGNVSLYDTSFWSNSSTLIMTSLPFSVTNSQQQVDVYFPFNPFLLLSHLYRFKINITGGSNCGSQPTINIPAWFASTSAHGLMQPGFNTYGDDLLWQLWFNSCTNLANWYADVDGDGHGSGLAPYPYNPVCSSPGGVVNGYI